VAGLEETIAESVFICSSSIIQLVETLSGSETQGMHS